MRAKFVNESLSFQRGLDPKDSLGIGDIKFIKKWLEDYEIKDYKINLDHSIDVNQNVFLRNYSWKKIPNLENLPEYIQFNVINGDFSITGITDLTSLRGFPKKVTGSFQFANNGIDPSRKEIREVCDIDGMITKSSKPFWEIKGRIESRQKYLKLGPISSRASHVVKDYDGRKTYSSGYKTYKVLQEIAKTGTEGLRYIDIIKFLKEMNYGEGTFDPKNDRGQGSGFFERPTKWGAVNKLGIIPRNTSKNDKGRYVINNQGLKTIEMYKKLFNE